MSKERELLKAFIDFVDSYEFYPTERNIIWEIVNRTQELLAQPVKRERLTDKEMMVMGMKVSIEMGYNDISPSDLEKSGCFKIIRAVEDHYGIGADDE